jgi:hypothetical protein
MVVTVQAGMERSSGYEDRTDKGRMATAKKAGGGNVVGGDSDAATLMGDAER